jgi:hypothetical protein
MKNILFFIFLVLILLAGNPHAHGQIATGAIATQTPAPIIEQVIITDAQPVKNTHVLCEDAEIRPAPYSHIEVSHIAPAGTEVQIFETYYENFTTWWALIDYTPIQWVNMSALCAR